MKHNNLIFLKPFTIKNPTLDQQNDFLTREFLIETECADLGKIYDNDALHGKNLATFIPETIQSVNPEWVIADSECATVALGLHYQKKILINPSVSTRNLNNVPDFALENTYAYFDMAHERDYERMQTIYPNAVLMGFFDGGSDAISLFEIKEMVEEIIDDKE